MTIYKFLKTVTAASGTTSDTSLKVRGGICRQVLVKANTASTTFRCNIADDNGYTVMDYGVQTGEFNDVTAFPMAGAYTFSVTNASADDTFKIYFAVEE